MSLEQKMKKFLNWAEESRPEYNLDIELYQQLKAFRLPLIFLVLMMLFGTLGYVWIDNFSIIDAFYQAGMTFTTVGFTEVAPISPAGRIFTIIFIFAGFGAFTFSMGLFIEVLKKGTLSKVLKERSMIYKIARLKNHFVICYHNIYTIELTKQFRENHIPFVVVDSREDLPELAEQYRYPYFIVGEPHTQEAILKTHLSSAKGLITLSSNIADNIALIASARLYEKELGRKPYFIMTNADDDKLSVESLPSEPEPATKKKLIPDKNEPKEVVEDAIEQVERIEITTSDINTSSDKVSQNHSAQREDAGFHSDNVNMVIDLFDGKIIE